MLRHEIHETKESRIELDETAKRQLVTMLTWLGILPFIVLVPFLESPVAATLFRGYSLAILCFLCGTWWSTALITGGLVPLERMVVLLACNLLVIFAVCLLLLPLSWALLPQAGLFLLQGFGESRLRAFSKYPLYYRRNRITVSSAVSALHLVAWVFL